MGEPDHWQRNEPAPNARRSRRLLAPGLRLRAMSTFERPAPDLAKLITAWEEWERGEQTPGRVLANLKTAGLGEVLAQLAESGWTGE
jgi:hypothetical protein